MFFEAVNEIKQNTDILLDFLHSVQCASRKRCFPSLRKTDYNIVHGLHTHHVKFIQCKQSCALTIEQTLRLKTHFKRTYFLN